MSEPLLAVDEDRDPLRPEPGAVRHLARHRAGRDGDADGPQRHGQDHDRALDHGADAGDGRLDPLRRQGDPRACRPIAWRSSASASCRKAGRFSRTSPTRENLVATAANRSERRRALDARQGLRAVPAARRAARQHGQSAVRRRAADAGDRPRADDQSAPAHPRRGDRRAGAADPRRDLAVPDAAQGRRPVDPGDRQERRGADPHRRPALSDRARAGWCGPAPRRSSPPRRTCSTGIWAFDSPAVIILPVGTGDAVELFPYP